MSDPSGTKVRIETPFLAIPDAIARDTELSSSAKLVFGCIYSLSMTARHCYAWNSNLARRVGLSTKQVTRLLPELEARGLIERRVSGPDNHRSEIVVKWTGKPLKMRDKKSKDKLSKNDRPTPKLGGGALPPSCPQVPTPKLGGGHKKRISNHPEPTGSGGDCNKMSRTEATRPVTGSPPCDEDEKTPDADADDGPPDIAAFRAMIGLNGDVRPKRGLRGVLDLAEIPDDPVAQAERASLRPRQNPLTPEQNPP
jgi:DNA-binding MarR family transcriptional regulator